MKCEEEGVVVVVVVTRVWTTTYIASAFAAKK